MDQQKTWKALHELWDQQEKKKVEYPELSVQGDDDSYSLGPMSLLFMALACILGLWFLYQRWCVHVSYVPEGHKRSKRGNIVKQNRAPRKHEKISNVWHGVYSKGFETVKDDSVLRLDDGHGFVIDVTGKTAREKVSAVADILAEHPLNWDDLVLHIKNGEHVSTYAVHDASDVQDVVDDEEKGDHRRRINSDGSFPDFDEEPDEGDT